jgi:chemotaxis protein histidine kinase CheA
MGDHLSENYLDQLLNSINGESKDKNNYDEMPQTAEEAFERELFGAPDTKEMITAKKEEDFLREFEAELLKDDIPVYVDTLEQELSSFPEVSAKKMQDLGSVIDDMIDRMPKQLDGDEPQMVEEVPQVDENADFEGELPDKAPEKSVENQTLDQAVDAFDEQMEHTEEEPQTLPVTEDGELDLSGLGESDLMDMLSEDQNLSDLGDMLSIDAEGKPLEEGDSIGAFAEAEMTEQQKQTDPDENAATDQKGKKKGGFLSKLLKLFFGEDEEEKEKISLSEESEVSAVGLSEENQQILRELEEAGKEEAEKKSKKKKEKPKKEKKAKKEPKPKKPKKEKVKKEKKPKEKDNTPPLPRGPVVAIMVMVASLFGLVMLVTNLLGYQSKINTAQSTYEQGDYILAYQNLQGLDIKEKDQELYYKLATLAAVSEKYQAYLVFDNYGSKDMALDSLVCAYGRYDLNKEYAQEYDCEKELENIGGKIVQALLKEYDMTGEEALEIYNQKKRDNYTLLLRQKLRDLGMEE